MAGYDVTVEFRSNVTAEIEGNKIIDWSLEMGDQVVKLRDGPRSLAWKHGSPIALVLRIAKDSPLVARADPQQPLLETDGQVITYRFSDPWALFTLLQRHRDVESSARQEGRSALLKFEFPLVAQNPGDAAMAPAGGRARVFMRLTVTPAGKKTPLAWPVSFPVRAPEWSLP